MDDDISGGGTTTGKEDEGEDIKRKNKKRRKKKPAADMPPLPTPPPGGDKEEEEGDGKSKKRMKKQATKWLCVGSCCWFIGCVITVLTVCFENGFGVAPLARFIRGTPGIRVRPVSGFVADDYFSPGYFVWAVLIANLASIGYEENSMYMASYDWRLSFQNTEVRDRTLSRIKSNIELMVSTNDVNKTVIIPHSMGVLYFLHFMKWVEAPAPMGGGDGPYWCSKHIKAVMNIGGPFLGVPKAVTGLFSTEARDIAVVRAW
ncbi:Phospholipid:diacylglycerol acyltransferase 1 [Linum perenne]